MYKALLLGHSFVCRLDDFIHVSKDVRITKNFNLTELVTKFQGYRGATLTTVKSCGQAVVNQYKPDIVVLQLVSNDLCQRDATVDQIFANLVEFVINLRYSNNTNVRRVIVNQVLYRIPPKRRIRYAVDTTWFNSRVDELNHRLDEYFKHVDGVTFYRLSGFWSEASRQAVFDPDGVHLNHAGNRKYYNNIRAALVTALRQLHVDGGY